MFLKEPIMKEAERIGRPIISLRRQYNFQRGGWPMSLTGVTALIILTAAALLGLLLFARRRGRLNRGAALIAALIIVAVASVTLFYPSFLTTTQSDRPLP